MKLAQLEDLYHRCLEASTDSRARLLEELSGQDHGAASLLRKMLASQEEPRGYVRWDLDEPGDRAEVQAAIGERTFSIGEVIAKRYRIEAFIAAGGMGEVYRAVELDLDSRVALKTIRNSLGSDPTFLDRLKQEVRLSRSIHHPHVCRVFDLGRDDRSGVAFLTMEFLDGPSLAERIRMRGRLRPDHCLALAGQMSAALDAAHLAGVVHRDFKPQNVLLVGSGREERAVVTDFGLAAPLTVTRAICGSKPGADPNVSEVVGTPAYMSPEQIRGTATGGAADVYAFGVVLYQACTGSLPFSHSDPGETLRAHVEDAPAPPSTLADLDPGWDEVILRAMAKDPADRYPTAGDSYRALVASVRPVSRRPIRSVDPSCRTVRQEGRPGVPELEPPLFGRQDELGELRRLVDSAGSDRSDVLRWSTVTGLPGIGKSRLLRAAFAEASSTDVPTLYVDFELRAGDPGRRGRAERVGERDRVDEQQRVGERAGVDHLDQIDEVRAVISGNAAGHPHLVFLNGLDRISEAERDALRALAGESGRALVIATSREPLGIPRERRLRLGPLEPRGSGWELLEERTRNASKSPGWSGLDRDALIEIAEELEGIPLALELAAARLGLLSPPQLLERLRRDLRILESSRKEGTSSLERSWLAWWELLAPADRQSLSALARDEVAHGHELVTEEVRVRLEETGWIQIEGAGAPAGSSGITMLRTVRRFLLGI